MAPVLHPVSATVKAMSLTPVGSAVVTILLALDVLI